MKKSNNFFTKTINCLKDFFNFKEWVILLRSVPAVALALITVSTVLMNILANKSIIELPWLIQDAGVILSWVGFLVGDLLVKNFGSKNAIRVNLTCLALSLFISGLLAIVAIIPGTWSSAFVGDLINSDINNGVNQVMGNVWYVILGSALASAVGLIINGLSQGLILKRLESKHGDKYWGYLTASATSTILGQFVDNFVFASLVSLQFFPNWTWSKVFICSIAGAIFELIIEMLFTPLTYKISKNWDKNKIGIKFMPKLSEENQNNDKSIDNRIE